MKDFDTDLKKYADKVRLRADERRELRERILAYMEYHPLPKERRVLPTREAIASESFVLVPFNTMYTRIAAGVFGLILIIGVPITAERAVPGDVLYPFKTHINEGIRVQFASSPYEKIVLETTLMERRIAEARLLASEGKLTEEVEAAIAKNVKGHVSAAQEGLVALRAESEEDAVIAEIAFGSALEVQSAMLEGEAAGAISSDTGIRSAIKIAKEEVSQKKSTTTPSYEGLLARVEMETTRAYELFLSVDSVLTDTERGDVSRRFADIDRKIEGAGMKQANNSPEAQKDLISALGLTQKLVAFITDINVRKNVALETLVPVELTLEERQDAVVDSVRNTIATKTQIETRLGDGEATLASTTDRSAVVEKIELGFGEIDALLGVASTSLSVLDIDAAEVAARGAAELVKDLYALFLSEGGMLPQIEDGTITLPQEEESTPLKEGGVGTGDSATTTQVTNETVEPGEIPVVEPEGEEEEERDVPLNP